MIRVGVLYVLIVNMPSNAEGECARQVAAQPEGKAYQYLGQFMNFPEAGSSYF